MADFDIRFEDGSVHLPDLGLWLDAHRPRTEPERVFVSHAHSDHLGAHREVILSEVTARLMQARLRGERTEHRLAWGERTAWSFAGRDFHITLLPAGHIFGSAMALVEADGVSLLYTGDFKLRPGWSTEVCQPRPADVLIMETTYGRPHYEFPANDRILASVIRFCREALDNDETPVLFGYSLGKSQEILSGLATAGLPIMLHRQAHRLARIYEEFGQRFPPYEEYAPDAARGKVVICPPSANIRKLLRNLGPTRTASLTGWSVDAGSRFRQQTDAAFPLSDHADFPDLVEMVRRVAPKRVYTLHGFAADFAGTLRDLGFDARALSECEQLTLPIRMASPATSREASTAPPATLVASRSEGANTGPGERSPDAALGPDTFAAFAQTCAAVAATARKSEKSSRLATYLRTLSEDALDVVATWFTGLPLPSHTNKELKVGWAMLRDVLRDVAGADVAQFRHLYLKHSDMGETAFELLSKHTTLLPPHTVESVAKGFEWLGQAHAPREKRARLADVVRRCAPLEAKYLVKIVTGDLRIGLKEVLVEAALATAFGATLDAVRRAHLLVGDLGETARLARRGELDSATVRPFRPVRFMLAWEEHSAEAVWARMTSRPPPAPPGTS